jgi:hypothetical protein
VELKKQKVYKRVFEIARDALQGADAEGQFQKASIPFFSNNRGFVAPIPFFDEVITLEVPGFIFKSSRTASVNLVTKIMLLHHVLAASGESLKPLAERIPYEDIPGCRHYQPVFEKRALKPLQTAFGHDRYLFLEAGQAMGGIEEEFGDASFTVSAFPMVPITIILWEGDEEFPPSVRMLFDPSITGYLPLEDIVVLSKLAGTRLIKAARLAAAEDDG